MKRKIIALCALVLVAALIFWCYYPLRSYVVMGVYSGQHSRESVQIKHGFSVDIPTGAGWYPFVLTYNAEGFAAWSGMDTDMSILYNFGAFDAATRTSTIYDPESDRYSAFYGAYVVHMDDAVFGLIENGGVDMQAITQAVAYDYTVLVLNGFGCTEPVFSIDSADISTDVTYAGSGGWTRIDADITTNGVAHRFKAEKTAYLQYGPPMGTGDFDVTTLYGRLYIKYLKEYDCTVMLYVIAPKMTEVDACDADILSKTMIKAWQKR